MSLSDGVRYLKARKTDKTKSHFYWEEEVKKSMRTIKDKIVENDIYTVDEIFRIINEEIGERLK